MRTHGTTLGLLLLLALAPACGGADGGFEAAEDFGLGSDAFEATADGALPDATPDAELADPDAQVADVPVPTSCAWRGRVLDEAGAPIEKVAIVICGEDVSKCVKATSKADGTWSVGGTARAELGAKVLGGSSGHTSVSLPLAPCTTADTDLGDVTLATPPQGQSYDGGGGDWLQVHPDLALQLPAGVETQMYETAFELQAAAVDLDTLHPLLAAQLSPLAVFALVPYDAETPEPVPFRVHLPVASTEVTAWVLDYLTGQFVSLGPVAVDASGVAESVEGGGLPQLTWVAFVAG